MSKKKFTDGLESIFVPDPAEAMGRGSAFLRNPFEPGAKSDEAAVTPKKTAPARKNFTTDLDSLLEEALQESFVEQLQKSQPSAESKAQVFHQQTHRRRPLTGIDMLIRRTVQAGNLEVEEDEASATKRLTITFDKRKLEKLKQIARMEKTYLKDILGDIVAEFIRKYENTQGLGPS